MTNRVCPICGSPFKAMYWGVYCSNACKQKNYRIQNGLYKKEKSNLGIKVDRSVKLEKIGFVYIMRKIGSEYCKIGISNAHPSYRLLEVIFDVHFPVELIHYSKVKNAPVLEKFLHVQFSEKKIELGTEWFELSSRDIESAKMLMAFQHAT